MLVHTGLYQGSKKFSIRVIRDLRLELGVRVRGLGKYGRFQLGLTVCQFEFG